MKTLGSSQRCWFFYLLIITLDLCLLTLEQLAFYCAQCSLYLIHTEHMEMGCSVVPVEKRWPEDARWGMMEWGRGEPTSSWGGAGSWLWFPSQLPQNKQRAGQQPWLKGVGGLPWWLSGKESACQCRRPEFNPWVGKIPCRRKWQPAPELLPGEPHGQRTWWATVHGVTKS